jgi:hypothetical protein
MKATAGTLLAVVLLVSFGSHAVRASHDPARFPSVLAALRSDESQADNGLHWVNVDILHGTTPSTGPCYNLLNNVSNDIARRLDSDAGGSALADRNWLAGDIAQMQMDINTLRDDVRDFENDNVPHLRLETAAIAALQRRITETRAAADLYIAEVNADVAEAYALARKYWTDHGCAPADLISPNSPSTPAVHVPAV